MMSGLSHHARTYSDFSTILDYAVYEPLPDDWLVGITDIVDSTSAIRRGLYNNVNYAGVSVIAALGNAQGSHDFAFSFAGDGAAFALPPECRPMAIEALQQVMAMARRDLGLNLRGGLLTVGDIRANGRDVRIVRYATSRTAAYTMFSGGGLKWAEHQVKRGRYLVEQAAAISAPDLTGLSCDWVPFPNRRGVILSLLVEPAEGMESKAFTDLARRLLAVLSDDPRQTHPLPDRLPRKRPANKRIDAEEWGRVRLNSDFRKYDDVLRLTVDCSAEQANTLEEMLCAGAAAGLLRYGLHRQSHALMTCLVPSEDPQAHLHFLDGKDGGYSKAAAMIARQSAMGCATARS
ncbi:MAG: DUF3095 family protein [Phyllobacterium sp.]